MKQTMVRMPARRRSQAPNDNTPARAGNSPYSNIAAFVVLWLLVVLVSALWAMH